MKVVKISPEDRAWIEEAGQTLVGVTLNPAQHRRLRAHLVMKYPDNPQTRKGAVFLRALLPDATEPYSVVEKGGT